MTITPFHWGPEQLVNTETTGSQQNPDITVLANGNYVVTWTDYSGIGADTSGPGIKAQMYNAAGDPIGGEFLVNSTTFSAQRDPTVTALANGDFVVAYYSNSEMRAQIFNADGTPDGGELLLSANVLAPNIVALANGGFAAVWADTSGADSNISVQRFDASGVPTDVNPISVTTAPGNQSLPKFAELSGGTFVVVWEDRNDTGTGRDIKAQLFNANGTKNGGEFTVNTSLAGSQTFPDVITLTNGNFVVAWQDGQNTDMSVRIFNASGVEVVAEFDISTNPGSSVDLVALADGGFVAVWNGPISGNLDEIELQRFDASGNPIGTTITVNTNGAGNQRSPAIDVTEDGRLIVVWEDQGQNPGDTDSDAIRSQILALTNDHTFGTSSGETLNGTAADNAIYGWEGNDVINGNDGDDVLAGGDGEDTLNGGSGHDVLSGGDGNDTLNGGSGNDAHYGGAGDDMFINNSGTDSFDGGEGSDTVNYSGHGGLINTYDLAAGFFTSGALTEQLISIENLITGNGHDTITGNDANNTINANGGDDIVEGGAGADILDGGANGVQGDTLSYANSLAGVGVNLLTGAVSGGDAAGDQISNFENVTGSAQADNLRGNNSANILMGGDGGDQLRGLLGADQLFGGAGDDYLYVDADDTLIDGGSGYDRLFAEAGSGALNINLATANIEYAQGGGNNDTLNAATVTEAVKLFGNGGADTLTGSAYADYIDGGSGNDTMVGNAGADILDGSTGADSFDGGAGDDIFYIDADDTSVIGGADYDRAYVRGYSAGVNIVVGSATGMEFANGNIQNDTFDGLSSTTSVKLFGQGGNDTLIGGSANDELYGGPGDDTLIGNGGNDILNGASGADSLFGGAGDDILYMDQNDLVINGGADYDRVYANGGSGALTLNMTTAEVEFVSGSAFGDNFTAAGSTVAVKIKGEGGGDTLTGGNVNDEIYGGAGTDTINGGTGDDFLSGGTEADIFVFDANWGDDTVSDFQNGIDILDLSSLGIGFGDLTVTQLGANHTLVEYNGQSITLLDVLAGDITASDFVF